MGFGSQFPDRHGLWVLELSPHRPKWVSGWFCIQVVYIQVVYIQVVYKSWWITVILMMIPWAAHHLPHLLTTGSQSGGVQWIWW
jgi:hypothetical protein